VYFKVFLRGVLVKTTTFTVIIQDLILSDQ